MTKKGGNASINELPHPTPPTRVKGGGGGQCVGNEESILFSKGLGFCILQCIHSILKKTTRHMSWLKVAGCVGEKCLCAWESAKELLISRQLVKEALIKKKNSRTVKSLLTVTYM